MPLPEGLLFDEVDRPLVSSLNWAVNRQGYVVNRLTNVRLHRVIMDPPINLEVDHKNGNKLDNRRENLRIVPHAYNSRNLRDERKNNRTGHRGIVWDRNAWVARATVDGRNHSLGRFSSLEEAAAHARAWRLENMPGALS